MTRSLLALAMLTSLAHAGGDDVAAHVTAARAAEAKRDWAAAMHELEAALGPRFDPRLSAELGWVTMQSGDPVGARNADVTAADFAGDDAVRATALYYLGLVEQHSGERAAARVSFAASLAIAPDLAVATALVLLGPGRPAPQGCYDALAQVLPARRGGWIRDGSIVRELGTDLRYCDTPDRIAVASITRQDVTLGPRDEFTELFGSLYAIERGTGAVAIAPFAPGSSCVDHCAPEGHAGCSETSGCTIATTIPGARSLRMFPDGFYLGDRPDDGPACSPAASGYGQPGAITCATQRHVAVIAGSRSCPEGRYGLGIAVYDARRGRKTADDPLAPSIQRDGDRDFSAAAPSYRFGDIALTIDPATGAGTLAIGKTREDCLALLVP